MLTNTLGVLDTECSESSCRFEDEQHLRVNEEEVLKQAIEILESATGQNEAELWLSFVEVRAPRDLRGFVIVWKSLLRRNQSVCTTIVCNC